MPYGIDNFEADFYAYVDLMRHTPSYADLKIFRFRGAHTEILADAKIQDLLGDPDITFNTQSKVDLTALAQTFPLQKGVAIEGKLDADLRLHCRLSSLKKQDLGRIRAGGKLNMQGLALRDSTKHFEFLGDASLAFVGNDFLAAKLDVSTIKVRAPRLSSDVAHLKATVKSTNPQDTTRIVSVECKLEVNRLKGALGDSLGVYCQKANATVRLQPQRKNPEKPQVDLSLKTDTLFCRLGDMKMGMDEGGFAVTADKVRDSLWIPKGIIGFNRLTVRTPQFALPIRMRKTSVTVGNRAITLRNASMRIGRSNLTASGAVHDLYGAMKHHRMLRANLEISSRNLDCNQLINSLNFPQDTLQAEVDTASSDAPMELFVIPKNIDFELQTNLKRVTYGKMVFENVNGAVDVRNQAVHLKNLSMRGLDADMRATLVYRAKRKARGYAGFDFRLKRINIGRLVEFAPSLDTIVPMLRSFKGTVDFEAAAETVLDSALNIKIPSLRAAVHIKGDSLVLMDGETFAEISKKLLFKNKERNVFDSISVNLTVDDGDVTIYPFVVQIDRYKAAVGGTQGLDMNFDYHISILKSPVPFKLGLNISGNLDDMKFRLGKTKYKDAVTPVAIRKVDSTRVNMGRNIVRDFEQVMNRSGGRMSAAEDVFHAQALVCSFADEVKLAGTYFVIKRYVAQQRVGNIYPEALSHEDIRANLRTEVVIRVRVSSRLFLPKLLSRDGGYVKSAVERLRHPAVGKRDAPRDVILLHRKRQPELAGIFLGQVADEEVCFPLAAFPVVPSHSYARYAHASGVLPFGMSRLQPFPAFIFQVYALVPFPWGGKRVGRSCPGRHQDDA